MAVSLQREQNDIISEINITPLTDVMLVLLIIFMVTATFFVAEPAMQVELPPAVSSELVTKEQNEITVLIDSAGRMRIGDTLVSEDRLTQALIEAARRIPVPEKTVVIRGDRQAAYGKIIWIMDAARLVGLRHVSLATERPERSPAE
jgi:biopolymer transport protein ExbD